LSESFQQFTDYSKEDVENQPLIPPGKIPQLLWQGKGEQVILSRQLFV
jgi:hypothetical protein